MKASSSKLVPFEIDSMDRLDPNDTHMDIGDIVLQHKFCLLHIIGLNGMLLMKNDYYIFQ
jgi:transposase